MSRRSADKLNKFVNDIGPGLRLATPIMLVLLSTIGTLIYGNVKEIKRNVRDFRQSIDQNRRKIIRLETYTYGVELHNNSNRSKR